MSSQGVGFFAVQAKKAMEGVHVCPWGQPGRICPDSADTVLRLRSSAYDQVRTQAHVDRVVVVVAAEDM